MNAFSNRLFVTQAACQFLDENSDTDCTVGGPPHKSNGEVSLMRMADMRVVTVSHVVHPFLWLPSRTFLRVNCKQQRNRL